MIIQNSSELAELLPHSGNMVLLDCVERYDAESITCGASSHLNAGNPLAVAGKLSVFAGIEYAAQAMALHNRLSSESAGGGGVRQGVVAVASKLKAHVDRLDELQSRLDVSVGVVERAQDSSIYTFDVSCLRQRVIEGRLLVVLV